MKKICLLLLILMVGPAVAGDLWKIVSTSFGLDGKPLPYTQQNCFPKDAVDPSQILGGLGSCTFDQKSGSASSMTFALTCRTPGMPAEVGSMKVTGDARLNGDSFDMRYAMTVGGNQTLPDGNFRMSGSVQAHKIGHCSER